MLTDEVMRVHSQPGTECWCCWNHTRVFYYKAESFRRAFRKVFGVGFCLFVVFVHAGLQSAVHLPGQAPELATGTREPDWQLPALNEYFCQFQWHQPSPSKLEGSPHWTRFTPNSTGKAPTALPCPAHLHRLDLPLMHINFLHSSTKPRAALGVMISVWIEQEHRILWLITLFTCCCMEINNVLAAP